jgi:hypothetical protein
MRRFFHFFRNLNSPKRGLFGMACGGGWRGTRNMLKNATAPQWPDISDGQSATFPAGEK